MNVFLKSAAYSLSIVLLFLLMGFIFPAEKYGGASPSEDYLIKLYVQLFLFVIISTTIFIYLFHKEFRIRKLRSVLLCIILHLTILSFVTYFSSVVFYDFLLDNYPNFIEKISERDVYNDIYPNKYYDFLSFFPLHTTITWLSVKLFEKLIDYKNQF